MGQRGQVRRHPPPDEVEFSTYNFEEADVALLLELFGKYEKECIRLAEKDLVFPAYDFVMKCSHTFNLLDARGAISVTERASYIGRVRNVARLCAEGYGPPARTAGLSDAERGELNHVQGTLLEIGAEEIPAGFVPKALASLEEMIRKELEAARLCLMLS